MDYAAHDSLIKHLAEKQSINDGLVWWMLSAGSDLQAYPKSSGFEALSSIGLDLLTNDSLRISITGLYQLMIPRIVQQGKYNNQLYSFDNSFRPYTSKYIIADRTSKREESVITLNGEEITYTIHNPRINQYELLLEDDEFFF